jgi:hypothetical protein
MIAAADQDLALRHTRVVDAALPPSPSWTSFVPRSGAGLLPKTQPQATTKCNNA